MKERAQKYLKRVKNPVVVSAMSILGRWTDHELEVLRSCIRTYGVGVYEKIISEGHLANRSTQSIYQATQKLLAKQSIYEYTKLQLDAARVAKDNRAKYGTPFYVGKFRVVTKPEALVTRFFNLFKYGIRTSEEIGTIPFYRRNVTLKERRDSLLFLEKVKRGEEDKERGLRPILNLKAEIADMKERVSVDELQEAKIAVDQVRCNDVLGGLRGSRYDELPDEVRSGNQGSWRAERIEETCRYRIFWGDEEIGQGLVAPRSVRLDNVDVRNFDWNGHIKEVVCARSQLFDAIIVDPPWDVAVSDPTRGLALGYEALSMKEIFRIPFRRLCRNGFVFVWVTKGTADQADHELRNQGFKKEATIYWVKQSSGGALHQNVSGLVLSAVEEVHVYRNGDTPREMRSRSFGVDIIRCVRLPANRKPDELRKRIDQAIPDGLKLEIFARSNAVVDGWYYIGNELGYSQRPDAMIQG
eukprot:snap_masked-scaffold_2-processed-gene-22.26-mRNA-1 protein AED:1.00 eAED:1.00 QI:0/-1/0/0/-1/1/1/0/469